MTTGTLVIDHDVRSRITLPPCDLMIDGNWQPAISGECFKVIDPSTEAVTAHVARAGEDDIALAVQAARRAVDEGPWSKLSGPERARLLHRLADLVERDTAVFAGLDTLDMGQPVKAAPAAIAALRYFAGWADKIDGRYVNLPDVDGHALHAYTRREPMGVIGAITPWNGPLMLGSWKIAPALAAGCSVVLKAPEDAPLSSLHLAQLVLEAGFPPGALNVVPGFGAEAGAALVASPGVDKITYTGSTAVGREVGATASRLLKYATLELGGKSPQVIFADADIEAALPGIARQLYVNSGQVCVAGTRILVERSAVGEVVDGLAQLFRQVKVGDPFDPSTNIGSLINRRQLDRVTGYVHQGSKEGAELVTGGHRVGDSGFFLEPTLFQGSNDMVIAQEEIFGPVGVVIGFDSFDEAMAIANATSYGLAAMVYTSDLSTAHRAAAKIKAGMIRVNGGAGVPNPSMPFGGMKGSGTGRELSYSGIEECTVEKTVSMQL
jgi:acyl-CoA reductase-like NAD-dependent aldehyde dehydrogenase